MSHVLHLQASVRVGLEAAGVEVILHGVAMSCSQRCRCSFFSERQEAEQMKAWLHHCAVTAVAASSSAGGWSEHSGRDAQTSMKGFVAE